MGGLLYIPHCEFEDRIIGSNQLDFFLVLEGGDSKFCQHPGNMFATLLTNHLAPEIFSFQATVMFISLHIQGVLNIPRHAKYRRVGARRFPFNRIKPTRLN